ncbi:MAG: dTDP-4-dehydrorhamnose 3,5-epimerase [Gammaproteobacteria bacterium]|nr:MAG: dTDP-4-dehydrorhamnose 3,5-epimerase [Gammaproteobacteria bacterium]
MNVIPLEIEGIKILEPNIFEDQRGCFLESFNQRNFSELIQFAGMLVQDNLSVSSHGVVRGLHYQKNPMAQGKLIHVISGEIFDVVVDLRRNSSSFGKHVSVVLSDANRRQLWVPPGFAHGFMVLSSIAHVAYKVSEYYSPAHERCILWNDEDLKINWPGKVEPILSDKDKNGQYFRFAECFL